MKGWRTLGMNAAVALLGALIILFLPKTKRKTAPLKTA